MVWSPLPCIAKVLICYGVHLFWKQVKDSAYFKYNVRFPAQQFSGCMARLHVILILLRKLKLSALSRNFMSFISFYNNKPRASDRPAANVARQMLCCHLATQKNLLQYQQTTDQFISSVRKTLQIILSSLS